MPSGKNRVDCAGRPERKRKL